MPRWPVVIYVKLCSKSDLNKMKYLSLYMSDQERKDEFKAEEYYERKSTTDNN